MHDLEIELEKHKHALEVFNFLDLLVRDLK